MSKFSLSALVIGLSLLQGCSTLHTTPKTTKLDTSAQWVLVPSINNTETPQAGARLDSITASLLRVNGVNQLSVYQSNNNNESLFDLADRRNQEQALNAVKSTGAKYAVAASVDEWRYKVGLDGEPAAGVTVNIIDLSTGQVVWSGTAAKTGWSREAVSAIAQKTVDQLLKNALSR
ncbi:MAG TPA: DUF4136 domain-containing protein [Agitococcus sp.]|uniref:DUF4136 domain-containing protein n=1 Tax=uncultured Agitococcus sp. TaxID=1506599 RepID=UPI00262C865F|nr:DUF4136 domain-containing protein [uncultured Agitococcus sp.]HMY81373.1 DUF4136 domain-containing protein [Agitococcus sp.]HNG46237.1 DUF4136 domain-containing protein [Agitococcus sp.]HNL35477.1 DUF4136 domain-containing protein [Agitococcus sp.]HRH90748.1 DUF4136 domain-containing protein [Agitococcus sp.]